MKYSNEYIYGKDVEVLEIPRHIVLDRLEKIETQIEEVQDEHYSMRDQERKKVLLEARDFWENIK